MARNYTSSATYNWTPSAAGYYQVCIRVRDSCSANAYDGYATMNFKIE
jgi:hypothetical protein